MTARTIITFTGFDAEGKEVTHSLPARWVACLHCFGEGYSFTETGSCPDCDNCGGTGEEAIVIREIADPAVLAQYDDMMIAATLDLASA